MKKVYIFAIPHKKEGHIIDARNPYTWEEVGQFVLEGDTTDKDFISARKAYNIPEEAYCVACKLLEV